VKANEHILVRSAQAHVLPMEQPSPAGWVYDMKVGAWTNPSKGAFMVHDPTSPRCGTKKNDLETGEDAKGQ